MQIFCKFEYKHLISRFLIGDAYSKLKQYEKSNEYLSRALELSLKVPIVPYYIISEFLEEEKYKFVKI